MNSWEQCFSCVVLIDVRFIFVFRMLEVPCESFPGYRNPKAIWGESPVMSHSFKVCLGPERPKIKPSSKRKYSPAMPMGRRRWLIPFCYLVLCTFYTFKQEIFIKLCLSCNTSICIIQFNWRFNEKRQRFFFSILCNFKRVIKDWNIQEHRFFWASFLPKDQKRGRCCSCL